MQRATNFYNRVNNKLQPYMETFIPYVTLTKNICGIYLLWVVVHFVSSHLYIRFCSPSTFTGFLMSPFMAAAPHCQALRWAIYNGGNNIVSMWLILGVWLMSCFPLFQKTEKVEKEE